MRSRQVVVVLVLLAGWAVLPAQANAFSSASFFRDAYAMGAWPSETAYDSSDSTITMSGTASAVTVSVQRKADPAFHDDVDFAAPAGQKLQEGRSYPNAQRTAFQDAGRPGLDVGACNTSHGSFEIIDLATGPGGQVTRLRAVWENHCNEQPPGAYGEVRVGFPEPTAPLANPSALRWPARDLQRPPTPRPIVVRAGDAAARFTRAAISGPDASAFSITDDGCTGTYLAAREACTIRAQFAPAQPGQRNAMLELTRADGGTTTTDLSGYAYGGTTEFTGKLNRRDTTYNQGKDFHLTAADGVFFADSPTPYGEAEVLGTAINTEHGAVMLARFFSPKGEHLVVGRTYTVGPDHPFYAGGPYMELAVGSYTRCDLQSGTFRIDELRLDTDGQVRAADISYVDRCKADKAVTMTGHFARRGGDATPPAAWMQTLGPAEWPPYGVANPLPETSTQQAAGPLGNSAPPRASAVTPSSSMATGAAPRIESLRLAPSRFRVVTRGKRRGGSTVVYRGSRPATTDFTFERRATVRRGGRRATRWIKVAGTLRHRGRAGLNSFALSGTVGGRALAPGTYRLTGTSRDAAGHRGPARHATFSVTR